jgi:hypothetical protein
VLMHSNDMQQTGIDDLLMNEWTDPTTFVCILRSVNGISNKRWGRQTPETTAVFELL